MLDARLTQSSAAKAKCVKLPERSERFAAIAASLRCAIPCAERRNTLVIEPSREGRDALTADIRAALAKDGTLHGLALTAHALASKGLTREEARDARSYAPGDIVVFRREYAKQGFSAWRCAPGPLESMQAKGSVALANHRQVGRVASVPLGRWQFADTFEAKSIELRAGDHIQFTRNDRDSRNEQMGSAPRCRKWTSEATDRPDQGR